MQATSDSRALKPVMERFREDGAPYVRLNAREGMKNAAIIYEAIKSVPGKALLRGDFDRSGNPLIYFSESRKKCIGKLSASSPIKARNIEADRRDMANFLSSIAGAVENIDPPDQKSLNAASLLRQKVRQILTTHRDIHISEVREPLREISCIYKRIERQKIVLANRALYRQQSLIQAKRFVQFCSIRGGMFTRLSDALKPANASRYDINPSLAVFEMKRFLNNYRKEKQDRSLKFSDYLRFIAIPQDVNYFAQRWMAISHRHRVEQRKKFETESWAREMDSICPMIIKAFHRQARVNLSNADRNASVRNLIYQRDSIVDFPPLPKTPLSSPSPVVDVPAAAPNSSSASGVLVNETGHALPEFVGERMLANGNFGVNDGLQPNVYPEGSHADHAHRQNLIIATPFNSDSALIADIRLLTEETELVTPDASIAYQPIAFPGDSDQKNASVLSNERDDASLYQLPKQRALTSSALSSGSLATKSSTSDDLPSDLSSVSATEKDPSSEATASSHGKRMPTEGFKLELGEARDSESEGDVTS